jgi:hypothetical protein
VKIKNFETTKKKIRNRGKKRTSTIIEFRLSQPAQLVFVFRGPGPTCSVSARIPAVGLAGLNRFRFYGYIGTRPLAAGTYLLTLRTRQDASPLAKVHLTIVDPAAPKAAAARPVCTLVAQPWRTIVHPGLAALTDTFVPTFTETGAPAPAAAREPAAKPPAEGNGKTDNGEALGVQTTEGAGLPALPPSDDDPTPLGFLVVVLLGLLAASLLAVGWSVFSTLRTPRGQR